MVWGIDPGNDRAGLAAFVDGSLAWHATVCPWDMGPAPALPEPRRLRVYVEVPQNGTHKSRGGVHFAAGMLVDWLLRSGAAPGLKRRWVRKVEPRKWWATHGIDPKSEVSTKDQALKKVSWLAEVESDDEADAILIGIHGCVTESGR